MSETVFTIKQRLSEVFKINNTVPPEPRCGEGPEPYRYRALSCAQQLLPSDHAWAYIPIGRQPLDAVERHIVSDRVAAFKSPTGPLREVTETCPRTNRVTVKCYGDTRHTWEPFQGVRQRITSFTDEGRGEKSPHAIAERKAAAQEMQAAYEALDRERASIGLR
jgi:hypothetical protein